MAYNYFNTAIKAISLYLLTVLVFVATLMLPRIAQPLAFHDFADTRTLIGMPNELNVLSNLIFLFVGIIGMQRAAVKTTFLALRIIYAVLFTGVLVSLRLSTPWFSKK